MKKMYQIVCFVSVILIVSVNCQVRRYNLYSCDDGSPLEGYLGPCRDTPGCAMPQCCGAVAGSSFNVTVVYQAKVDAQSGSFGLYISGLALTANNNDPLAQVLQLPLSIPSAIITYYDSDMCYGGPNQESNPNFCPQYAGQTYRYSVIITIPYPVTTTATLVSEFKGIVKSGSNTVVCATGAVRIISPVIANLLPVLPLSIIG